MLKTFIVIAYRHILKNRVFSSITVLGLTLGIAICLSITLIVQHELNFNKEFQNFGQIYRIHTAFSGVFTATNPGVPVPVGKFAEENLTGYDHFTSFFTTEFNVTVNKGTALEKKINKNEKIILAEPSFFEIFPDYKWLAGNPKLALKEPFGVVLVASQAQLYYNEDIDFNSLIGEEIIYSDSLRVLITGIVSDLDFNSDLIFTDFISKSTRDHSWLKQLNTYHAWDNTGSDFQVFLKLNQNTVPSEFAKQLIKLDERVAEANPDNAFIASFKLQPLSEIHANVNLGIFNGSPRSLESNVLKILSLIGFLILLIAIINFINLETAQSASRAKEIGVRKVMGSRRKHIVIQYLTQSLLLSLIATLLSLPLIQIGFYFFKHMLPAGLKLSFSSVEIWLVLITIALATGLLAGAYPALIISRFQPVQALKSKIYSSKGRNISSIMRKSLTVFQFGFAQLLVAFTLAGIFQMNKLAKTELGFQKAGLLHMNMPWSSPQGQKDNFIQKLMTMPEFDLVTTYSNYPSRPGYNTTIMSYKKDTIEISSSVHSLETDTSYFDFFGLKLEEGRIFVAVDSLNEIVVNRSFMNYYGFNSLADIENGGFNNSRIVGVLQDYHFQSLHHKIEPIAIRYYKNNNSVGIRLADQNKNKAEITAKLETLWNSIFGNTEFSVLYIIDSVNKQYKKEENIAKLVYAATGAAIFISCLGLFGLVSFTVAQRTKEIGVRKVLGASTAQIMQMISFDFIKLVCIAFIISLPISYYFITMWLDEFTVRIQLGVGVYMATLLITVLLAIITLIYQTLQIAVTNPVVSLRDE